MFEKWRISEDFDSNSVMREKICSFNFEPSLNNSEVTWISCIEQFLVGNRRPWNKNRRKCHNFKSKVHSRFRDILSHKEDWMKLIDCFSMTFNSLLTKQSKALNWEELEKSSLSNSYRISLLLTASKNEEKWNVDKC